MYPRRRRAGELFGPVQRILGQDRFDSQNLGPRLFSHGCGFGFDVLSQGGDALAVGFRREMSPAGEGREDHRLGRRILEATLLLAANPGGMLLAAIKPMTGHRSAFEQGSIEVDAGPILNPFHELLFDALCQNILAYLKIST